MFVMTMISIYQLKH